MIGVWGRKNRKCSCFFSATASSNFFSWNFFLDFLPYRSTDLYFQKAYTHSGTSSIQCVYQIWWCILSRTSEAGSPKNRLGSRPRIYALAIWYMHWMEDVPEWVYAFYKCKPVDHNGRPLRSMYPPTHFRLKIIDSVITDTKDADLDSILTFWLLSTVNTTLTCVF